MILPFSAPIPTSSFIRVVLCICGMACQDMAWPRPSIRWKRGACSSHLMCRQRATRNRVAMRAACLVLMALGEDKMSLQFLEFLLCHNSIQYPYDSLSSFCILIGSWVTLGLTCRLTILLLGQRILSMVMVFFLKSRTAPISCKFCLSINQVVQRCLSSYFILHNVRGQFYRLASRIFHRICQSHPPFCLKGAV